MEIKEAIEIIESYARAYRVLDCPKNVEAFDKAIAALAKQFPMKPDEQLEPIKKHMEEGKTAPFCPVCGKDLLDEKNDCYMYCPECGQKIDWTDEGGKA